MIKHMYIHICLYDIYVVPLKQENPSSDSFYDSDKDDATTAGPAQVTTSQTKEETQLQRDHTFSDSDEGILCDVFSILYSVICIIV